MTDRLTINLQSLVDSLVLTRSQASAVHAYAGDFDTIRKSQGRREHRREQERRGPRGGDGDGRWSQGPEQARKRVRDAEAVMGLAGSRVVHFVGYLDFSLAEASVELGYDGPEDVRILLRVSAKSLLEVYDEFALPG